jgi:hypothetical protein
VGTHGPLRCLQRPNVWEALAVLPVAVGVKSAIACAALRPNQQEKILVGIAVYLIHKLAGRRRRLAIYLQYDVSRLKTCILGWAGGPNVFDHRTMQAVGSVDLLTGVGV